ncbi:MAG: DUF5305 family protein [Bacilli bacterium]|nr:DUF5305 family protein [Bacilli bacterium]MDD4809453.1 DUF5305 family protein [Bacilli bacterium]
MNNKKFILRKEVLNLILLVLVALTINSGYRLFKIYADIKSQQNDFIYKNSSTVDYDVYIHNNDFIKEPVLSVDKTYITELVDNIKMKMTYRYQGDEPLPIKYQHSVVAILHVEYNDDPTSNSNPVIWETETIIKPLTKFKEINGRNFTISESFDIDITEYNQMVKSFKEKFSLPILAHLELKMPISFSGNSTEYRFDEKYDVLVRIPLDRAVFDIETQLNKSESKSQKPLYPTDTDIPVRQVAFHIILLVMLISLIITTFNKKKRFDNHEEYEKYMQKIKDDYGEIIVETNTMVDSIGMKPVSIISFDEMLNLSNSLLLPIMLFEEDEKAVFYVAKDKILYVYIIKQGKPIKYK